MKCCFPAWGPRIAVVTVGREYQHPEQVVLEVRHCGIWHPTGCNLVCILPLRASALPENLEPISPTIRCMFFPLLKSARIDICNVPASTLYYTQGWPMSFFSDSHPHFLVASYASLQTQVSILASLLFSPPLHDPCHQYLKLEFLSGDPGHLVHNLQMLVQCSCLPLLNPINSFFYILNFYEWHTCLPNTGSSNSSLRCAII